MLYAQLAQLRAAAAQYAGPAMGLSVYAPSQVRGLRQTAVSGYLRFPDGSPAGGVPLTVEFLRSTSEEWTTVGSAVCAADGSWRTTVELRASGRLRAVFGGDGLRARIESAPRNVAVIPQLSVKVNRRRMRVGKSVQVSGNASPATHVRLTLSRRSRRRWVRERRRLLRVRNGTYRVRLRPRSRNEVPRDRAGRRHQAQPPAARLLGSRTDRAGGEDAGDHEHGGHRPLAPWREQAGGMDREPGARAGGRGSGRHRARDALDAHAAECTTTRHSPDAARDGAEDDRAPLPSPPPQEKPRC